MKAYSIIAICFIVIALAYGVFLINTNKEASVMNYNSANKNEINKPTMFELKSELQNALKTGGITPEKHEEITQIIFYLENQGYDKNQLNELREILSQLSIGGQSEMKINQPIEEDKPNQLKQTELDIINQKNSNQSQQESPNQPKQEPSKIIEWDYDKDENKWKPTGNPPDCPELIFKSPVDVSKATAILYPGQQRGKSINDYKSHGGFRYDNPSVTSLKVIVPFDGYVWRGARFLVNGEVQYGFDLINECGIMHRLGHLTNLSPEFQRFAEMLPEPKEGDSRTTVLSPYLFVKKGDFVATQVKTEKNNIGMDWGVYDLRKENEASKDSAYRENHWFQRWYDFYSICWLDYLSEEEELIVKMLPGGDGVSGKNSDYCK